MRAAWSRLAPCRATPASTPTLHALAPLPTPPQSAVPQRLWPPVFVNAAYASAPQGDVSLNQTEPDRTPLHRPAALFLIGPRREPGPDPAPSFYWFMLYLPLPSRRREPEPDPTPLHRPAALHPGRTRSRRRQTHRRGSAQGWCARIVHRAVIYTYLGCILLVYNTQNPFF